MDGGRWKGGVRESGTASAESGGYANTGIHIGDVYREPVARSAYLEQVEQIFPWRLEGRSAELAELAAFCSGEGGPGYVWWQGLAWAGKSALMATLVLHPPAGARVVSFFITARYAGQSDRQAFLDVVLPQLAELLGQSLPPLLGASTQQGWFNRLLKEAARACAQAGERLVLVVDGLDEDLGVTVGPGAHSIAALLPPVVAEGLRVVVAGRPNPPVPSDVPVGHPLRDTRIVRVLTPSPAAQVIRDDAERELEHVLHGDAAGRELLGLLVAAGGGLSVEDLAELTESPMGVVRKWLHAVSGRTFTGRESQWRPGTGARVFVLAHEELHAAAVESLGAQTLSGCRDRIHAWAQGYRDRGWPAETPEYLLSGYHRMLLAAGDLVQLVECAIDQARLDRMLDRSGGDGAALVEVITCQRVICGQDNPDLYALLLLAHTREFLADRNAHIPPKLPAVWARLGNPIRGEALARSITDPGPQAQALNGLAAVLIKAGEIDHALRLAHDVEVAARSIAHPTLQVRALSELVAVLIKAGEIDHALRLAHDVEVAARSVADLTFRARALNGLVAVLIKAGEIDHALRLAHDVETIARSTPYTTFHVDVLSELAAVLAEAGEIDHALRLTHDVKAVARSTLHPGSRAWALSELVVILIKAGEIDQALHLAHDAETTTRSITHPDFQVGILNKLVAALAEAGEIDHALRLAHDVETIARSITHPNSQVGILNKLVSVLAE
ncbi:hypothetical protein, partial [Streptosporangium sp. NPDC004631]